MSPSWNVAATLFLYVASVRACPECAFTPAESISHYGYASQQHNVTTLDGFRLSLIRVASVDGLELERRPPVLLMHGLLDSCFTYIQNPPHQSLAYILVDAGFDVWLGNSRGNIFSLPPCDREECWDFSYDEMAEYDIPAMVDYVLASTGFSSIGYIGHSQGTIQMFAAQALSTDGVIDLRGKINSFIALAPVAYVKHQRYDPPRLSPLRSRCVLLSILADLDVDKWLQLFGVRWFMESPVALKELSHIFCSGVTEELCVQMMFMGVGEDPLPNENLNASRVEIYLSRYPTGTSVKNVAHWAQDDRKGYFRKYNYGWWGNLKAYGHFNPPDYDLGKVHVPVALFSGTTDALADSIDVERMREELPTTSIMYDREVVGYNHLDFVWGLDAAEEIYGDVVRILRDYAAEEIVA